jgi:hypothetical protein
MSIWGTGRRGFLPTKTFLVGKDTGAPFATISEALTEAGKVATSAERAIVCVSPGQYDEDIVLPDFVSLIGMSAGVHIAGSGSADGFIVEVKQGVSIEDVTVVPKNANKEVGLIIQDATLQQGDEIVSSINGTLIVNGKTGIGGDDETFTFTGESTTDGVVALINATAVNVYAYNRYGKLAIISKLDQLIIRSTGTANADLGYSTSEVTKTRSNEPTVYLSGVSIIGDGGYSQLSGGQTYDVGLELEDKGYGSVIINGVSITGSNDGATGVGLIVRRGTVIGNNLIVSGMVNGGLGVWLEKDNKTTPGNLLLGTVILIGNTTDFDGETGTTTMAMLVNSSVIAGSSGFTYTPTAHIAAMAKVSGWPYSGTGVDGVIEGLTDSSRKLFIPAEDMYSPSADGAADVEVGTLLQKVKSFVTAADKKVTFKRKHVDSSETEKKSSATLRLVCSISADGAGSDTVRISTSLLSVAIAADLSAAGAETLVDDVDVSSISADDRFDVTFDFTNAGVRADPNDITLGLILREGTHGNDTYGGSLYIWGAEWEV